MTLDVKELRRLAEAATPGPWRYSGVDIEQLTDGGQGYPLDYYPDSADVIRGKCEDCGSLTIAIQRRDDAAFIAAANPSTVLALLDQLESAYQRGKDDLRQIIDTLPGPSVGDDPVAVAKQWNGDSGNREPDFDMNPDDTASLLAAAVIKLSDQLAAVEAARDSACDALESWVINEPSYNQAKRDNGMANIASLRKVGR